MHRNIRYSVGILAGGKSRRMGENKAFLSLNGKPFITGIVEEFRGLDVMISIAADAKIAEWENYVNRMNTDGSYADQLRFVHDTKTDAGPLAGFEQLLTHAKEDYVFICAVDMPFLKRDVADELAKMLTDADDCICLKDDEHVHPMCALYAASTKDTLCALLDAGHRRVSDFLDAIHTRYIDVNETCLSKLVLRNINTKEEYHEAVNGADS